MPVFRADASTDLAIQSALAQSYRNIEVIIVDDGSGDGFADRLGKWERADPRVKVVFNKPNSGAYTSRNIGYSLAKGEFITIFDGDDWQHPQKIQMLVAAATEQEDHRLVSAPWSRVDEDLMFHYRGWRGAYVTPAHVSTMFPVRVIRQHLGYWDTVRKAADTEFILRYQLLVNAKEAHDVAKVPLTLSLVSSTNLSIDDFRMGYRSPDRVAYRAAYEHWHTQVREGRHTGYLDFGSGERAFPAPSKFLPVRPEPIEVDELFVGDFGASRKDMPSMWRDINESRLAGRRIGLLHVPSILHTVFFDASFTEDIMDEFAAQRLTRVELTDDVRSEIVNVYDPTSFQFTRELRSEHVADTIVVRASEPPFDPRTGVHKYAVTTVARNLGAIFGGTVQWTAEDPKVAALLERTVGKPAEVEVLDFESTEILASSTIA
jgi:glycosyltransferase involved in cell wall biosynthesis